MPGSISSFVSRSFSWLSTGGLRPVDPHVEQSTASQQQGAGQAAAAASSAAPLREVVVPLGHLGSLPGAYPAPFAFAGFWEPGDENVPDSYTILTTKPNALIKPIHHRMPVILTRKTMKPWLGSADLSDSDYRDLTQPISADEMQSRAVNRYVNNSRHDGPQCLAPPDEEPRDLVLF